MHYSNTNNISLALAVFLASDDYDYEANVISATSLMRSTRQYLLAKRIPSSERVTDISSVVSSRMGTAIHNAIEQSWLDNPGKKLEILGYPKRVYDNIMINPSPDELAANVKGIPIYMEQRSYAEVLGYRISGKFDFVGEGKVQDFKSTSVWNYMNQTNKLNYILQLSIYRFLNPTIITKDTALIHYIFTDWSQAAARTTKGYPANRVLTQELKLMSLSETLKYIQQRLTAIKRYSATPEQDLPLCTPEELWRKDTVWKYYKNPEKTSRSTKNYDNQRDALLHFNKDGSVGIVKEVLGQAVACKYCSAFSICTQKDALVANGELVL